MFRKQDEVSANTMQLLYQQSRSIEELNNTFLQNRETSKSDIKSTGTNTSGYTDDDFSGSSICPKYVLYDANNEHIYPKLCENKPVDSFQIGHRNSHSQTPFDQDSKPISDLLFGRRNSPRPLSFSLDDKPTGYLQFGRGNSPRPSSQN